MDEFRRASFHGDLTASVASLVFGLVLTMRQLTASPLTQLGLVGAPPAPPKR